MPPSEQTPKPPKRPLYWLLRAVVTVAPLFFLLSAGFAWHPPLLFWALSLYGSTDLCTSAQARIGLERMFNADDVGVEIGKQSKQVRTENGLALFQTPRGNYWVPTGTEHVLGKLLAQQQLEFYGDKETGVQPGQIVLDCGAHIGVFVAEALKRGAAKVVAIEPAPSNVECLRRNFEKEIAAGRVVVAPVGVWDQDDVLPLYEFDHNSAADSFIIQGKAGKVLHKVPLTTIDKLVTQYGLERVDYIKMDIKGAARKALEGAKQTIARHHPRVTISTEEAADDPRVLRGYLAGLANPYTASCGVCTFWQKKFVHPDVMFFR